MQWQKAKTAEGIITVIYYGMKLESLNCHWMGYDSIPIKMFLLILVLLLLLVVLVPPGEAVE